MEITVNVTSPSEMSSGLSKLSEAIEKFERQWRFQEKDQNKYHLTTNGEYNREVCDEIQNIYISAGWSDAICKTSSERGGGAGYTILHLWRKN